MKGWFLPRTMVVSPGDTLIVRAPADADETVVQWLVKHYRLKFPDNNVVVLADGLTVEKLSAEQWLSLIEWSQNLTETSA